MGSALEVGRCGCPGYTAEPAAFSEPVDAVEVARLRLRRPGEPPTAGVLPIPPKGDLFDEARRLRDLTEFRGVPWRPHE